MRSRADRMGHVVPSPTLRVAAEADRLRRQGVDIVDLGAGEPDFPTPEHIKDAAHEAIRRNCTKYTPAAGMHELREAICERYREDDGISVQPAETIVTAGAKQALYNAALALFQEGDEVVTHAPCWPTIPAQITLAGATPVIVQTHAEDGFAISADAILSAVTPRTRGIVINSPCNPTGALISDDDARAVADAAAAHGLWVIADVTYEKLVYDNAAHHLVRILRERHAERSVICSATSKAYAMTGWRCGWAIAPSATISAFNVLQGHSTSNAASISQHAALAALRGPQESVSAMRQEYRERRDRVHEWLTADPRVVCQKPRGAFYLLPYVADVLAETGLPNTAALADALLHEAHVAVTAGEGFDAPGFFRLSYATSIDRLREGISRIHAFVRAETSRSRAV